MTGATFFRPRSIPRSASRPRRDGIRTPAAVSGRGGGPVFVPLWEYADVPAVTAKLEPPNRHEACFLPRASHVTGNIQIHEMAWGQGGELWVVNTRFSCLCTLDRWTSFAPQWRPPFVSELEPTNRCHLNGLAMVDGRPRYVTALSALTEQAAARRLPFFLAVISMRLSLRAALLMMLSILIGTTVLVVGAISYRDARFTATNLSRQLLLQTSARIESEIENLLGYARKLNAVTEQRLKSGQIRAGDSNAFVQHALAAAEFRAELSGFFIGLESTGESVGVSNPEQLVDLLREYLNTVCNEIEAAEGTVDKYIGDGVMAFWDAPTTGSAPDQCIAACTAALRCQSALAALHKRWMADGKRPFRTRIGLHTGDVGGGNFGCDARLNYTIIGDAVNLSNRLEGLNRIYGKDILISESTYQQAGDEILARPLDYVAVKGRRLPVLVYELIDLKAEGAGSDARLISLCTRGLEFYRSRNWCAVIARFEEVLRNRSADIPATLLLRRCQAYQATPPGPDWHGVHRMDHK